MKPEFIVKKSAWKAVTFWRIILCWLIIPLLVMIFNIISLKCEKIEFYEEEPCKKAAALLRKHRYTVYER